MQSTWGVDISSGLSWNSHIDRITGNANRSLNFIKSSIKTKTPKVRETAYNALVCPQLEYAAPMWDPHTKEKILQVENSNEGLHAGLLVIMFTGQRNSHSWSANFEDPWTKTDWCASLSFFYKIVYGLDVVPLPDNPHTECPGTATQSPDPNS